MVNIDEAFEVRLKINDNNYQVLVDFDKLKEFRKNSNEVSVYDVLADTKIFKDQKKGEIASETNLEKDFPTKSEEEILMIILLKGEAQIPTSYQNKVREEKKTQIINYIAANAVNPATNTKYSTSLIESEFNNLKYNINPDRDHTNQAEDVIKLLKRTMPIKIDKTIVELSVPPKYLGAFYGPFRKYGEIKKEFYDNEGNLRLHIEVTSGSIDEVINYIKSKSNNEASYHISKT